MKKTVCIFLSLFAIIAVVKAQEVVKVGAFNFYPAIFQDTDGLVKGFYVDALNELGKKEDLKFVFVYGSWDEGLERIKTGEVDILTSVAITEERLKYLDYTETPLLTVWSEVYVNQKSEINGILDLEGKTIAVMKSDFNGGYLKQLTKKLSVNCVFVETSDFEEVFKLISDKKVDAGVVNNTFGAPKSEDYGLLSSGIIFNPFDIFFTVKKGSKEELLDLLNKYLHNWKHDRNSVFNAARQKWSHKDVGAIEVIPKWLQRAMYSALLLVLLLIVFIGLLRYKVRVSTEKVKYSELLFKTFMENTPAYVYIKDHNLNHIYRNKKVNEVNSVSPNDNVSSAKTIFEPHIAELVEKTDKELLSSEKNQFEIEYYCSLNGEKVWLHDHKFYLSLPNGKPAIGGLSFNITKLKETEFELIKAKEKAEESDRLKSAFLANMSHEIRTPMNGIIGFAGLLKDSELTSDQQREYIKVIESSGERMLNIINDIVNISKIESGIMDIHLSEMNVNDQLEFVYNSLKLDAERKNLSFSYINALTDNEVVIKTDSEKFYSILTNLVNNAIKYTVSGKIEFGYKLKSDCKTEVLEFFIKDTGIGIPKDRQEAIFERFIQADIGDKMARQGFGLGLSISKAYVTMLGGRIWLESKPNSGSTFYFTIPYSNNNNKIKEKPIQQILSSDLADKPKLELIKLLIVEDDETSEILIEEFVGELFKVILKAKNGIEAVNLCRQNPDIDLILMDIQMPVMNGYEATQQIRQFNKEVIIIAQTAFAFSTNKEKAIEAGCSDYISKPINREKLIELIHKNFENKRLQGVKKV